MRIVSLWRCVVTEEEEYDPGNRQDFGRTWHEHSLVQVREKRKIFKLEESLGDDEIFAVKAEPVVQMW